MKKLLIALFLCLLPFSTAINAAHKTTIEVACYPPYGEGFRQLLPDFYKAYPNIEVKLNAAGYGDHHNALVNAVMAGTGVPDAAVIEIGYIPFFVAEGGLEDLNHEPYLAKKLKNKMVRYTWAQGTTNDGRLIAFPLEASPGCAYWRRDIFTEVGINIDDIKTMKDLFSAAGKITSDTDGDGKTDRWFTSNAENIAWMILRSSPRSLYHWDDMVMNWDSKRITDAFSWAKKFHRAGYTADIEAWSNPWFEALQMGTTAYEPSGAWLGGHLKNWMAPQTIGLWGVTRWPALKSNTKTMSGHWGGSFLSIPHKAKHKKEAWKFIKFVSTDKKASLLLYQTSDLFPACMSSWRDPYFFEEVDFFAGQRTRFLWTEIASEVPDKSTHKFDYVIHAIIGSVLKSFLEEEITEEWALQNIKSQIEITPRRG